MTKLQEANIRRGMPETPAALLFIFRIHTAIVIGGITHPRYNTHKIAWLEALRAINASQFRLVTQFRCSRTVVLCICLSIATCPYTFVTASTAYLVHNMML